MTEEERNIELEKLFRVRLEENEIVAGSGLESRFMRHLDRREFLRFNSARFNLWYLAAAAAGLALAGLLLLHSPESEEPGPAPETKPPQAGMTEVIAVENKDSGPDMDNTIYEEYSEDASVASKAEPSPAGVTLTRGEIINSSGEINGGVIVSKTGNEMASIKPVSPAVAVVETSATSGCVPLHVTFSCPQQTGCTVLWDFGDGGRSTETTSHYIYDIPGTYTASIKVTDQSGRTSTTMIGVEAWARPTASFEIRKNDIAADGDKVTFLNLSTGAVQYLWDFGDGTYSTLTDPSYRYGHPGSYDVTLMAYSETGCADSLTINDAFTDKGTYLRFPTAFTPNPGGPTGGYYNQRTDEDNQVFHPVGSGIASYDIKIYSKTGMLVFESDDPAIGWDGYYKGQLCAPGVYVWKVRGTYVNGQQIIMAGDVTMVIY